MGRPGPDAALTVTMWLYVTEPQGAHVSAREDHWRTVLALGGAPALQVHSRSRRLRAAVATAGAELELVESTRALPLHGWAHVALVVDGRCVALFIDGEPAANDLLPAAVRFADGDGAATVGGCRPDAEDEGFVGLVTRLRFQEAALSHGAVRLMSAIDPPAEPRVADEWGRLAALRAELRAEQDADAARARAEQRRRQQRLLAEQVAEREAARAQRRAARDGEEGVSFERGLLSHFAQSARDAEARVAAARREEHAAMLDQAEATARRREEARRRSMLATQAAMQAMQADHGSLEQRELAAQQRRADDARMRRAQALEARERALETERERRDEARAAQRAARRAEAELRERRERERAAEAARKDEYRRQLDEQVQETRRRRRFENQLQPHERTINRTLFQEAALRALSPSSASSGGGGLRRNQSVPLW